MVAQTVRSRLDWEAAFKRESRRLEHFFRRRLPDSAQAEDFVAKTFERAIEREGQLQHASALPGWLFAIARRLLADTHRAPLSAMRLRDSELSGAPSLDELVAHRELHRALDEALKQRSERERRILRLKFADRRSNREIAESLGLTEANVAKITYRSLLALRAQLADWRPNRER